MRCVILIVTFVLAVVGTAADSSRIVGGTQTVVEQYPFSASLLFLVSANNFRQICGASIINNRSLLTAAHCFDNRPVQNWRVRVGSTNAHSGGTLHTIGRLIVHPNYRRATLDSDLAVIRSSNNFAFNDRVRPGSIAGASYNVPDNTPVWAIGWGATFFQGNPVEQLRHVQVRTVSQATCRSRYAVIPRTITDNMLCSGWLDIGGRGQCQGDSGSPVLHNHVIVGITSWGEMCAQPFYPTVNVRVNRFTSWIMNNA